MTFLDLILSIPGAMAAMLFIALTIDWICFAVDTVAEIGDRNA